MYLGLDLAWSTTNPTGACALDCDGTVIDERMLGSDDEIIEWITGSMGESTVVGIDAPLHVPNETGRRPCEAELQREYGGRKAGPHPANRRLLLANNGVIRGEQLVARLEAFGFSGPGAAGDRTFLEVYPHPAIIEVFGLEERLIYKAKRGVTVAGRRSGLRALSRLLGSLESATPPLLAPPVEVPDDARGAALKEIEDRLDARMCAWVASVWGQSPNRIRLFGDRISGQVAVPQGVFVSS